MVISLFSSCFPYLSHISVHWKSPQSFSSAEVWPSSQAVACALNGEEPMFLPLFVSILACEFLSATLSLLAPTADVTNHLFSVFRSHWGILLMGWVSLVAL